MKYLFPVAIIIALAFAGVIPLGAGRARGEVGPDRSGRGPSAQSAPDPGSSQNKSWYDWGSKI
jgi:hypothetical protein